MMQLILECDGGSRGNPGRAGTGSTVQNSEGQELGCVWEFITRATNNVAEYRGLINGLRLAEEIAKLQGVGPGDLRVEVRMDSKLVVEQMSGRWKIKHPDMKPLAEEAKGIAAELAGVSFNWVPRAQNARADELANRAMDDGESGQWIDEELVSPAGKGEAESAAEASESLSEGMLFDIELPGAEEPEAQDPSTKEEISPTAWLGDKQQATTLLLLRHGQTELNRDGKYSGRGNPEMTELGQSQIQGVAQHLKQLGGVDVILSSPLDRCQQAAKAVAEVLGGVDVQIEEDLIEMDFGTWEGKTFDQVRREYPQEHADAFISAATAPHGGETPEQVYLRVSSLVDRVVAEHQGKKVLVLSHMMPIKSILRRALGIGGEIYRTLHLDVASLSVVDFLPNRSGVVRLVNATHYPR